MVTVHILSQHSWAFNQALRNILTTEVAMETYAQILDGLPMFETARKYWSLEWEHPIKRHKEICHGVTARTEKILVDFDPCSINFDEKLLAAYETTELGSVEFELRLMELLAVACHYLAVEIIKMDVSLHKDDGIADWRPPPRIHNEHDFNLNKRIAKTYQPRALGNFFRLSHYSCYSQYPNGKADVVGYWAECNIFGGVIVFDRGPSEDEGKELWMHPGMIDSPETLYQPTDEQLGAFLRFILTPNPRSRSPLPMQPSRLNRRRVGWYEAMKQHHIFRDKWERRLPAEYRPHCCFYQRSLNFPARDGVFPNLLRAYEAEVKMAGGPI